MTAGPLSPPPELAGPLSPPPEVAGPRPDVSVVVPTYNRAELLARLLDALEAQQGVAFEIIVVDDCSTDGTWELLGRRGRTTTAAGSAGGVTIHRVRTPVNSGPATARNIGWRRAAGHLIAFIDDDCVPQPGWLEALAGAFAAGNGNTTGSGRTIGASGAGGAEVDIGAEVGIVQGATLPLPEQAAGRGPFAVFVWVDRDHGRYETCNIAYRRDLLEELGGFDESFGTVAGAPVWGEDVDLGWRAREAGARIVFEPAALAHCQVHPSDYLAYLRQIRRHGGLVRNVARHPGLRRYYPAGLFLQASHPTSVLALAGLMVASSRPGSARGAAAAVALALPYVWYRSVTNPLPCRRRNRIPVLILAWGADLADTATLASASVRYRCFFI
ncbi:MAG: glycosyltransferase family 2 protein [Acidimicrobiales bacterium]